MNAMRAGGSWQIIMADLSLILFIAVAAAVRMEPVSTPLPVRQTVPTDVNFSSRVAGDDLPEWLANYSADPRERLQVVIDYEPDGLDDALTRARAVQAMANKAGQQPRIVLQPNVTSSVSASFAFDAMPPLARDLQ